MRKNAQFMHPKTEAEEAELAALRDYGFVRNVPEVPDWYYYDNQTNLNK